jgi:hypothetical protein
MRKFILSAALLAVLTSAKAQMSSEYVGKNSIENLKLSFKYTKFSAIDETIEIGDTTYSIDWKNLDVTVNGAVHKITRAICNPIANENAVWFNGTHLVICYSQDWKRAIGYRLKDTF